MILCRLIEFPALVFECAIGISFNARVMGNSDIKIKQNILAALLLVITVLVMNQYRLFSFVTTVLGIVGIAAGASVIYKIKAVDSIIISAGYVLLIYVIDFLSIALLGLALRDENFASFVTASYSLKRLAHIVLTKTLLFAIYYFFIRRFMGLIRLPVRKMWTGLILCGAVVYYLGCLTFSRVSPHLFITWTLQFLLVLMGMYSISAYKSLHQERKKSSKAEEQTDMLAENYETLIQRFRSSQMHYHDMKNHNLVLEGYLRTGKYEKAEAYMKQLSSSVSSVEPGQWTGIGLLDFLLECKQREAKEKKIYFNIHSEPICLKLSNQELAALFGNALDNAIEACGQMEEGTGWIRVDIRRKQEMVFVKITNSSPSPPRYENGRIVSSKADLENHGWGWASMQAVVDRNSGAIDFEYGQCRFTVTMTLFN